MKELVEEAIKDQEEMIVLGLGATETYAVRYSILILKDILKQYEYIRNDEEAINDTKRRNATSE